MVAEPTSPSTWMVPFASKLSLSKADFIVLPFFGSSSSWSKVDGMVQTASRFGGRAVAGETISMNGRRWITLGQRPGRLPSRSRSLWPDGHVK